MAWGTDAHPQLRSGTAGYGRYYWRGFLDKADGNYLVIFALPRVFHEDERYYAMGTGGFWKRAIYSASRILITPDYHGHNTFNAIRHRTGVPGLWRSSTDGRWAGTPWPISFASSGRISPGTCCTAIHKR